MSSLFERMMKSGSVKEASLMSENKIFLQKEYIHTGIPIIDVAFSGRLDGGITPGITIIAGQSKSFKTLLMLLCLQKFLDTHKDGIAILYDTEWGITPEYLTGMGIDTSRILYVPIDDVEQLKFDCMARLNEVKKGDKVFIAVDSLGMIASKKETEDALNEKSVADMSRAKAMKSFFRLVTPRVAKNDLYFIAIQHTYDDMGMYPKAIVAGGTGQIYAANTIFIISKAQIKQEGKELEGFKFTLNIEKSRYVKEKAKLPFDAEFETGIFKWSALFDLAKESGFIEPSGKGFWITVDPETGETSDKKLREKEIKQDDSFFEKLIVNEEFKEHVKKKYLL